ncbi:Asp-tRNA(Asn)/Glu-tRNA(Gln) amidotransferase subunit GatB [Patescibacteria group bacterium]|nr:Asp-tRNA(Asn)/Glu-tRNA(Gln) amidotransferase subunit GatB [Patescibacteria group bacterium]
MTYQLVLGLEIHLQLNSARKMFCGCSADIWQAEPNTHTCPTCLGLPGALPVPNFESVQKTQLFGLALNCQPNKNSHFDRKHYFYPDLPKGYQISQYKEPLCGQGEFELSGGKKVVIERVHLEEDTAKSFHEHDKTLIDFNKSGISLMEIVTAPCFTQVAEAVEFGKKIQDLARVLQISGADMEKGQLRLEANVSLRTPDMAQKGELSPYKVEIKNINSFRFMEKAVLYEIKRQSDLLAAGQTPRQENRGWNESKGITVSQREKEEAHDYRYFPDPDLPPMCFDDNYLADLKASLPELPEQIKQRLIQNYQLNPDSADFLTSGAELALVSKFEAVAKKTGHPQLVANLLINKKAARELPEEELVTLAQQTGTPPTASTEAHADLITQVLTENPAAVQNYLAGKQGALEFLVGQVMKAATTRLNAGEIRQAVQNSLTQMSKK